MNGLKTWTCLVAACVGGACSILGKDDWAYGRVTAVYADKNQLAIQTENDGKEIVYPVFPGDIAIGYEGKRVKAKLTQSHSDDRPVALIWPADPQTETIAGDVNGRLHRETVTQGRRAYRAVGDRIPDFALYNQHGELVRRDTFRGKNLVVNFIFTRCMSPTMCPASTMSMAQLQKRAKEAGLDQFELVTITFDPDYDTPGVLYDYGKGYGVDFGNFTFLTGDPQAIQDLMRQFGILVMEKDGTLNHTMATILVDGTGRVIYRREGSIWSPDDFIERLKTLAAN